MCINKNWRSEMEPKDIKEQAADLFNAPNRVKFREFLKTNTGEYDDIEFKGDYIECPKLAKHIIAMANSGGGMIIFGMEEDEQNKLTPIGIDIIDKTKIKQKLAEYIPETLEYEIHDFHYEDEVEWKNIKNMNFSMIIVEYKPRKIPFLSKKDGRGLHRQDIYCRKNCSTEKVMYEDIQDILEKRRESSEKYVYEEDLEKDLEQLQILSSYLCFPKSLLYPQNILFKEFITQLTKMKVSMIKKELKIQNEDK